MFFDKILFFLHVRISVGKHFDKLSMRCECRKVIEHLNFFFGKFWEVEFSESLGLHLMWFSWVDFRSREIGESLMFISFVFVIFVFDKVNSWLNFLHDFSCELFLLDFYFIIIWKACILKIILQLNRGIIVLINHF